MGRLFQGTRLHWGEGNEGQLLKGSLINGDPTGEQESGWRVEAEQTQLIGDSVRIGGCTFNGVGWTIQVKNPNWL